MRFVRRRMQRGCTTRRAVPKSFCWSYRTPNMTRRIQRIRSFTNPLLWASWKKLFNVPRLWEKAASAKPVSDANETIQHLQEDRTSTFGEIAQSIFLSSSSSCPRNCGTTPSMFGRSLDPSSANPLPGSDRRGRRRSERHMEDENLGKCIARSTGQ